MYFIEFEDNGMFHYRYSITPYHMRTFNHSKEKTILTKRIIDKEILNILLEIRENNNVKLITRRGITYI